MFKQLRKNYVIDTMIVATVILTIGILILYSVTYTYNKNRTMNELTSVRENYVITIEEDTASVSVVNEAAVENAIGLYVLNEEGTILFETGTVPLERDVPIEHVLTFVQESVRSDGVVPAYTLRYLRADIDNGCVIVLGSRAQELSETNFQLLLYVLAALGALVTIFVLSSYLAGKSIRPIENTVNSQNQFLADASHELKTPLTVISANLDIVQSHPDEPVREQTKWLESSRSEINRLVELINDMLKLYRSETEAAENYDLKKCNLTMLLEECIMSTEALVYETNIKLESDLSPDVFVVCDETKLKQVFYILIDNAVKYMNAKDGEGLIKIVLRGNEKLIQMTFFNNGDPIPEEKKSGVFDRFFRAEESRTIETDTKKGGYGLGLSIARNIIESHNGKIGLNFSDETGTCFSITLPGVDNKRSPKAEKE